MVGLPHGGVWQEMLNTDASEFGGGGLRNGKITAKPQPHHGQPFSAVVRASGLAGVFLKSATFS